MDALTCAYSYDSYEKTEGIEYEFIVELLTPSRIGCLRFLNLLGDRW